jgi:Na+/phosphate symporter
VDHSPGGRRGDEDPLQVAGESLVEAYVRSEELRQVPWLGLLRKAAFALAGAFTFILGIQLMQVSAEALIPTLTAIFGSLIEAPRNALGFGWLVTYAVLSGSPIAALALGFFDAEVATATSAYFMIMGSRFGASFIVIVIGIIAILRGGGREESLSMGVLAFLVTYTIYIPALFLGFFLLDSGRLASLVISTPPTVIGIVNLIFGPIRGTLAAFLPPEAVFFLAFLALYVGFSLFDRAFHRQEVEEVEVTALHRAMEVPLFSFVLGAGITLLSTSVSLSLGMLVPLYLKGYLRRRDVIPYIIGANITTFVDTLLVAFLLDNPAATNIVLIAMLSVAAVSVLALLTYRWYSKALLWLFHWTFHSNRAVIGFVFLLLIVPLILVVV